MVIEGVKIASYLQKLLQKEIKSLKKKGRISLAAYLIGQSPEQLSYIKIKSHIASQLKIDFQLINLKSTPNYIKLANLIRQKAFEPAINGIIIQLPLPQELSTDCIFDYIPNNKEIEGHKKKSPFFHPLGLAVLTIFKYIYGGKRIDRNLLVDFEKDRQFFKKIFKNKKVVLIGKGMTGGKPIGHILGELKINYINVNSSTINPESYFKNADVIITAVGKKIIHPVDLKQGVVLINVGLRRENGKLKGDYDEDEVKDVASFYTKTPGGIGPIDVIYLFKNLIEAAKLQR